MGGGRRLDIDLRRQGLRAAFFRYHHDAPSIGATRWLINSIGYVLASFPVSARVFAEAQHHYVWKERGGIRPAELFGTNTFWSVSAGVRLYFGGGPMRMGTYGVLDPMTAMHREMAKTTTPEERHDAPHAKPHPRGALFLPSGRSTKTRSSRSVSGGSG